MPPFLQRGERMTYAECITRFDGLKYNTYHQEEKLLWLEELEEKLQVEVVENHEEPEEVAEGELTAPKAFESMYLRWLEAQVDYANGEYERYNNAMAMFMAEYEAFRNWYTRGHMPKGKGKRFRF